MMRVSVFLCLLAATALAKGALVDGADSPLALNLLANPTPAGAVCLDGSAPGYYYGAATDPANANDWVLFVQGGGWCYEEMDCAARANTSLGSSAGWASGATGQGPMSRDCSINPVLCNYNLVLINYCDGASFSGDVEQPVSVNGQTLYFRGRRIMTAVINDLLATKGLDQAERVLMSGCSAGGLTTFLHADYVGSLLPSSVRQFGAMPGSGYFLLTDTVEGKAVYPNEMNYVYTMQNASGSLNAQCQSALGQDAWQCIFAEHAYRYLKTPSFILNSAYDSWQASCIFTSEPVPHNSTANGSCGSAPGWHGCVSDVTSCNSTQTQTLSDYQRQMVSKLNATPTFHAFGNGAFLHSCYSHCLFYGNSWATVEIAGVPMNQAFADWWSGENSSTRYMPCEWDDSDPDGCNPTC